MTEPTFLILATPTGWRLAGLMGADSAQFFGTDLDIALDAPAALIAGKAAAALHEKHYVGQGVTLGIPSTWCYSATIQTTDLPRNDRKAMVYRLEEKLPLAAEAMVADFVIQQDGAALGVCTRHETLRQLIDALEARNIAVQSVAPLALLAGQGLLPTPGNGAVVLFISDDIFGEDVVEALTFDGGTLVNWAAVPATPADVQFHLDMISMAVPASAALETCGLNAELTGFLQKRSTAGLKLHETQPDAAAVAASQRDLAGQSRQWVEFRRGPLAIGDRLRLYRKPLNAALAAGIVLMLCVATALFIRAHRYASIEAAANQQVSDAFREQFPGWEVPVNVRAVVESEHRKAAASAAPGASTGSGSRSAFQTFKEVLAHLPIEGRISIRKMSFEESSFDLEGQVRSYEQLDGIAAAARKAGMEVATPESRKNAEGFWDFTLHGALPANPGAKASDEIAKGAG